MKSMGIDNIEEYPQNLYRLLNTLADFEGALQQEVYFLFIGRFYYRRSR